MSIRRVDKKEEEGEPEKEEKIKPLLN